MPRSLFISDLHLDSSRPATIRALDTFLHDSIDADALYILGDLFEA
jgi:UDP-2,3-diacylglucosamine hydrolase